nr:S8 family serine peptidase [uncultured Flavobacterium sp.]
MKKKYTSLLVFLLALNVNYAQSIDPKYTSKRNISIEEAKTQYSKDVELAIQNNIPLSFNNPDGSFSEFVRFEMGAPVYYRTLNSQSASMMGANRVYPGGDLGLNLTGRDVYIGVWDQGAPMANHSTFGSRLIIYDDPSASSSLHHTHVAGTVLGAAPNTPTARGIAYAANGFSSNWTNDISEMRFLQTNFGIVASNHSYGVDLSRLPASNLPSIFGKYTSASREIDELLYEFPYYSVVFAAGNDRDGYATYNPDKAGNDLLTSEGVAKNTIVVGAVEGFDTYNGPSSVVMSSFSNYGPTDDFRIKPDLVSKGVSVYSSSNTSSTGYTSLPGTSMAAPSVTGAIALIQQKYNSTAKAATVKGLLLHTAKEAGTADGPDHKFGWGQIDVAEAIYTTMTPSRSVVEELTYTGTPQIKYIQATGNEPLKVSISWTDPSGNADNTTSVDDSTPKLRNDLDIRLTQNGTTYSPWYLNKDFNDLRTLKGDNNVDPFERIDIDNPSGVYQLTISNKGSINVQNFSLIITGGYLTTNSVSDFDSSNIMTWVNNDRVLNVDATKLESSIHKMSIYDVSGRLVLNKSTNSNVITQELNGLTLGYYILNLDLDNGKRYTKKIYVK